MNDRIGGKLIPFIGWHATALIRRAPAAQAFFLPGRASVE